MSLWLGWVVKGIFCFVLTTEEEVENICIIYSCKFQTSDLSAANSHNQSDLLLLNL